MRSAGQMKTSVATPVQWSAGLAAAVLVGVTLMLSGCNTAKGVGQDVSATGAAVTRGAQDVKSGL